MVYGTYSYSYWGESKPTWPHCNELWPWLKLLEVGAPDWLCFFATWKFELWGTTSYLTMTPLGQLTGLRFVVVPSGKHTKSYWKLPFIVGLPMKHDDFPWLRYYQRVINSWSCFFPPGVWPFFQGASSLKYEGIYARSGEESSTLKIWRWVWNDTKVGLWCSIRRQISHHLLVTNASMVIHCKLVPYS